MDWTPLPNRGLLENEEWMRPQRLFAPSEPTGLEGLLEKARLKDDQPPEVGVPVPIRKGGAKQGGSRIGAYGIALLVALLAVGGLVLSTGSWAIWRGAELG